jgi:hypothetical protein
LVGAGLYPIELLTLSPVRPCPAPDLVFDTCSPDVTTLCAPSLYIRILGKRRVGLSPVEQRPGAALNFVQDEQYFQTKITNSQFTAYFCFLLLAFSSRGPLWFFITLLRVFYVLRKKGRKSTTETESQGLNRMRGRTCRDHKGKYEN